MEQRNFNQIINFSRLTAGTAVNQQGALVLFDSNQPRFDYDPTTLDKRGILVEDQVTNLFLQSSSFNLNPWVISAASVVQQPVSQLGVLTAPFRLTENTATAKHGVSQTVSTEPQQSYTFSVFVKQGTRTKVNLEISSGSIKQAYFDLSSVQVLSQQDCKAVITAYVDGWFRLSISFTSGSSSTVCSINLATADGVNSYLGNGSAYIDVQAAQLENSSYVTSYIPTTGSQVTRAEDLVYLEAPSLWFSQGVGTLFVEATAPLGDTSDQVGQCVISMSDEIRDNYLNINRTSTEQINFQSIRAYNQVYDFDQTAWVQDSTKRIAYAFDSQGFETWVNSSKQTDSNQQSSTGAVNALNTYNAKNFGGWIRRIKFYPWAMNEQELKELTS